MNCHRVSLILAIFAVGVPQAGLADCVLSDPSQLYTGSVSPPVEPNPGQPTQKITGAHVAIYMDLKNCAVLGVDNLDPSKQYTIKWVKPDPNNMCGGNPNCFPVTSFGVTYCRC